MSDVAVLALVDQVLAALHEPADTAEVARRAGSVACHQCDAPADVQCFRTATEHDVLPLLLALTDGGLVRLRSDDRLGAAGPPALFRGLRDRAGVRSASMTVDLWFSSDAGHPKRHSLWHGDHEVYGEAGYNLWMPSAYGDRVSFHRSPLSAGDPGNPAMWRSGVNETWTALLDGTDRKRILPGSACGGHAQMTPHGALLFRSGSSRGTVEVVYVDPRHGGLALPGSVATAVAYPLVDPAWSPTGVRWVAQRNYGDPRFGPRTSTLRGAYADGSPLPEVPAPAPDAAGREVVWNDPAPHPTEPDTTAVLAKMPDDTWAIAVLRRGWFPGFPVLPKPGVLLGPPIWFPDGSRILFQRIDTKATTVEKAGWQAQSVDVGGGELRSEVAHKGAHVRFPSIAA